MFSALQRLVGGRTKDVPMKPVAPAPSECDPLPRHWCEHPIFAGAGEVVSARATIEGALAIAVGGTRAEGEALAGVFGERPPRWPQYDEARAWLRSEGARLWWNVNGETPEREDGLQLFSTEALRAHALPFGVKGRSKAELAQRLRAVAPAERIVVLEREGRTSWEVANRRRELRKFYEVLAHGVAMSRGSIANVRAMRDDGFARRMKWTSGLCCSRCSAADGTTVAIGCVFPHVGVVLSPAHPGCCCVEIAELDF
jgi:hypothetical protein